MADFAEQGAEFGFGDRELDRIEDDMQVFFLEFERYPQFFQDGVVGHRQLHRLGRAAVVLAATVNHQAIQKVRHDRVRAAHEAGLFFFLDVAGQGLGADLQARQLDDAHHLGIIELEHVAQAAQYIVVVHLTRILF
ncbi:hypothetical protein D3C76_738260 [compost metagenome]